MDREELIEFLNEILIHSDIDNGITDFIKKQEAMEIALNEIHDMVQQKLDELEC